MKVERKNKRLTNYSVRVRREKIHRGNGKSLVKLYVKFGSDFLCIYLILNRVSRMLNRAIKITLLTLQSVVHGRTEL